MRVKRKENIRYFIELNRREAMWLRSFLQNYPVELDEEDPEGAEIRKTLFDGLKK